MTAERQDGAMMDIKKIDENTNCLMAITQQYEFLSDYQEELNKISAKVKSDEITVPVIGEFDSGKSTLLNKLLADDFLLTDVLPTTSNIFEIRFSRSKNEAEIVFEGDIINKIDDLKQLKKIDLSKAKVVKVYSSSSLLPQGLCLIDTPGISSDIAEHEKTLVDYVPISDAIIFAIDVNQGFTKTSMNFLQLINPLNKKVYIVFTKAETKSPTDIESMKKHSMNKLGFRAERVLRTSANKNDVNEFIEALKILVNTKAEVLMANADKMIDLITGEITQRLLLQLESADLDVSQIETKMKTIKAEIELLKLNILEELAKSKEKFKKAESLSINAFYDDIISEVNNLTEKAFDKSEQLEQCFDDVIKKAANHALLEVYKREIENITQELSDAIDRIPQKINVGNLLPLAAIKLLTEAINIVILDILIPGGYAEAMLGRVAIKLAERWPGFKDIWDNISKPIREFVQGAVEIISKKYVKTQIEKSLKLAKDAFAKEISRYSYDLQGKMEEQVKNKFAENEKNILETLQSLKHEKEDHAQKFTEYVSQLKKSIAICEEIKIG